MLLLIDNYDSFTFNIVHFLGDLGADCTVIRNDKITPQEALALKPEALILSPGPCTPDKAGICLELIDHAAGNVPVFGICLGHQAIGQAFGGKVVSSPQIMHGKMTDIRHNGKGVFNDVETGLRVTRYHSLIVERDSLPACLEVTAETDDGIIMALAHKEYPIHSGQFHPESIATRQGHKMLGNFLKLAGCPVNHVADATDDYLEI